MPNRIIRESCRRSETLARLTGDEERLFWRLTTAADDYGRFDGRPEIVRAECFPLMLDTVGLPAVRRWLDALERVGLVRRYVVAGRPYLAFATWATYQETRAQRSKYPAPLANEEARADSAASAPICAHLPADAPGCSPMLTDVPEKRDTRSEKREARSEEEGESANADPPVAPTDLLRVWNDAATTLPKARGLSPGREKHARQRLRERPLAEWRNLFVRMNATPFLCGENERGWRADFGWIVESPENALKVLEGKYDRVAALRPVSGAASKEARTLAALQRFASRETA